MTTWALNWSEPVTVVGVAAEPKVAVAVMVKGVVPLITVTTPRELTLAMVPVVSLLVQVT